MKHSVQNYDSVETALEPGIESHVSFACFVEYFHIYYGINNQFIENYSNHVVELPVVVLQ